jgi:hypothetical protein
MFSPKNNAEGRMKRIHKRSTAENTSNTHVFLDEFKILNIVTRVECALPISHTDLFFAKLINSTDMTLRTSREAGYLRSKKLLSFRCSIGSRFATSELHTFSLNYEQNERLIEGRVCVCLRRTYFLRN